ncbi:MAG: hypothetical protein COT81_03860 [Candidatus Buchananbacteria bacterium CG10_big_fil_rev_8_21_14_0_10_42_9]|uniref:General secretion pathway GspH domain-containing protein n=1 Tax=Candidatus Buchananbacteria bacterium CG10_big_fil_rev_8_21_14_0_10_42_9 TaxID=1974526 RepID=A0A2H0W0U5_9BACT|nr:MAG: hypothetical protein COT81_03860 [Candidatus Buchananbacteria bacterium CG10_big_fil_rev_8_21_14_0_10_42_9]
MKLSDKPKGFTAIELLLALGVLIIVFVIGIPAFHSLNSSLALKDDAYKLVNSLRMTQNKAIVGEAFSDHGIYLHSDDFVIFSVDEDETYTYGTTHDLTDGVSLSSSDGPEVRFVRKNGTATNNTIILTDGGGNTMTIQVDASGKVSLL